MPFSIFDSAVSCLGVSWDSSSCSGRTTSGIRCRDYSIALSGDEPMAITLEKFVRTLSESGLMTSDESTPSSTACPPTAARRRQGLAREMVRRKQLTKFQAQAVYQGKTQGLVLGNYVILDKLGEGGMGQVFKAQHRRMERVVALKVLPPAAMKSPDAVERFQREVKAAARLLHPNIVTAYDADEDDGRPLPGDGVRRGQRSGRRGREGGPLPVGPGGRLHPAGGRGTGVRPRPEASSTATSSRPTCCWTRGHGQDPRHGPRPNPGGARAERDATAADGLTAERPGDGNRRLHVARAGR